MHFLVTKYVFHSKILLWAETTECFSSKLFFRIEYLIRYSMNVEYLFIQNHIIGISYIVLSIDEKMLTLPKVTENLLSPK